MHKMYEGFKVDVGLQPISLASTNATGAYYSLADFRRLLAVLDIASMVAGGTAKLEVFQATNAAAGSAQLITGATATITANTLVSELTIALASVTNGQTITINGLLFTAHTDTTTVASRQFSIAGTNTQDGDELVTCINDPTYGVPGVTATNSSGTLTLVSTNPGAVTITASSAAGTVTIATTKAQAYVEVDGLTLEDGFTHVACKVTTAAATVLCGAVLLRGGNRQAITQAVGASASV